MFDSIRRLFRPAIALAVFFIAACGGDDGGGAPPPPPPAAVAPTITQQPANAAVAAGQAASFAVAATGTAPLAYQWQRNGVDIAGATAADYTTPATVVGDSGATFRVRVSNSAGSATSSAASLTVSAVAVAPAITTQPANASVTAGQTATFAVVATGTAPLAYQWQRNGAVIAGATAATYTTPATVSGDNGATYRVVVGNAAGSATSNNATLTVVAAPPITVNLVSVTSGAQPKQLGLNFATSGAVATIRALLKPNDAAPYQPLPEMLSGTSGSVTLPSLAALDWTQARIRLQACTAAPACVDSNETLLMIDLIGAIGYFKASNTAVLDLLGRAVAISGDGNTLAIGAPGEASSATGIDGNQADNGAGDSGAVYVFTRSGGTWTQQAYVKASNTGSDDDFGTSLALSADGSTLAVGAPGESSSATAIDGDQASNAAIDAGAVYVFTRGGTTWTQQAFVKASNTGAADRFGTSVALAADGNTLVAGALFEDSAATGVNGNQADNTVASSGAAYVFTRAGATWSQQAYLKASNTQAGDEFGATVAISGDGNTVAVGATGEDGGAPGINGDQANNTVPAAGAVYVFSRSGSAWTQQAYFKASNPGALNGFGISIGLASDGSTMAVGASAENSAATGINGNQDDNSATSAGAVYVFVRAGVAWSQQAYIKASNTGGADFFGRSIGLAADGNTLVAGAHLEDSNALGLNGDQANNTSSGAGAAYTFTRSGSTWTQQAYLKASKAGAGDQFGWAVALSGDGRTVAVGAPSESNSATGVNGNQFLGSAVSSGAVYLY